MIELAPTFLLCAVAAALAATDLARRTLPNALTVTGLVLALSIRAVAGVDPLMSGLSAAGISFGIGLVVYLTGGLGGGDVKMLAAAGAALGLEKLGTGLFATAMTGALLAGIMVTVRGRWVELQANLHTLVASLGPSTFSGWRPADDENNRATVTLETEDSVAVPYGVAIATGTLIGWFVG